MLTSQDLDYLRSREVTERAEAMDAADMVEADARLIRADRLADLLWSIEQEESLSDVRLVVERSAN